MEIKRVEEPNVILSWELGYGNPRQLTKTKKSSGMEEKEIIKELISELNYCRKNQMRVITVNENDFKILRTRSLQLQIDTISLQGLNHLSLDTILQRYFHLNFNGNNILFEHLFTHLKIEKNNSAVTQFQQILMKICPLIPREAFYEGQP